jgi:hypothetical protein
MEEWMPSGAQIRLGRQSRRGNGCRAPGRGLALPALIALLALLIPIPAMAHAVVVPLDVQAQLLVKVAAYDRSLRQRASGTVRIAIVIKAGDPESQAAAKRLAFELGSVQQIAGLPVGPVIQIEFTTGAALAADCRAQQLSILYLAPGLDQAMAEIAKGLDGVDVLTAAADPSFVPKGAVFAVDLVAGKPQMLVSLGQAQRQNVRLASDLLKLAKVLP